MKESILGKKAIKKENIQTLQDANTFMDKITKNLKDNDLIRAYNKAKEKYKRKPTDSIKYMADYFKNEIKNRGLKID